MSVVLESAGLRAKLVPEVGGELRSLRSLASGRELLFQATWPDPGRDRRVDEVAWTEGWRGGWQALFPNAGEDCLHQGRRHPFHGDASLAAFEVVETARTSATLRWRDRSGATLLRRFALTDTSIRVDTEVGNAGDAPADWLLVDHLVLGGELAAEGARVEAVSDVVASASLGDDWSRMPRRGSLFGALTGVAGGGPSRVRVAGPARDLEVELRYDAPHLWLWVEAEYHEQGPWNGRTRCLGLEPATTTAPDGLAARAAAGDASRIAPGERATTWTELHVVDRGSGAG